MILPGYAVDFRGLPACPCLVEWLPRFEAELQRQGRLQGALKIYQLIGDAPASGGVHKAGGAFDVIDLAGHEDVKIARQMGADATWERTSLQGFDVHVHGVLRGCPHNSPARYQLDAVDAGFNGLGLGGRGGPDDGPRPLSGRTWEQGIKWQRAQEDDMPSPADWDDADWKAVTDHLVPAIWGFVIDNAGTKAKGMLEAAGRYAKQQLGGK